MEVSILKQTISALLSIVLGLYCGVFYDVIKIFRLIFVKEYSKSFKEKIRGKAFPKIKDLSCVLENKKRRAVNIILVGVFDLLFFISLIPVFCIFTYATSNGVLRWYIFVFALLGVYIYKLTLGKLTARILDYMSFYLHILYLYIKNLILLPIKKLNLKGKIQKIREKKRKIKKEAPKERNVIIQYGK